MQKRKIVKQIKAEYWDTICPVCGNRGPPIITYTKSEAKILIEMSCSKCNLTVTYCETKTIHKKIELNNSNKNNLLRFIPNIFNSL
ncbi:MAG: hypothetical protein FK734_17420 [Asgard group archaeon]|nr:hypothetical protein [Asgard group archaeon]